MYTLDASVHISALNPHESGSAASQALLRQLHQRQPPLFCPAPPPIEVAAAMERRMDNAVYSAVAQWVGATLITLDRQQLDRLPPEVRTTRPADIVAEIERGPYLARRPMVSRLQTAKAPRTPRNLQFFASFAPSRLPQTSDSLLPKRQGLVTRRS